MRLATAGDAPEIASLIQAVWADHNPDPDWIARVSLESNHATLVETSGDDLIGFVDAFSTVAADGTLRWEIDLLGVHPDWRGRGVAQRLVRRAVEIGRERGAEIARALVRVDNAASLAVFARCGFTAEPTMNRLCVSAAVRLAAAPTPADAFLLSVSTLTYSGVWIEGEQSAAALRCAQAIRTRFGWDTAGAVIPAYHPAPQGYVLAGQYRWLTCTMLP